MYEAGLAIGLGFFFYRHCEFLVYFQGYSYNMKVNVGTGSAAGIGWVVWGMGQRKRRPYVGYLISFVVLSALSLALEILDFPPMLYVLDAHALWHLTTGPITILLYKFIMYDCTALSDENRKEKYP